MNLDMQLKVCDRITANAATILSGMIASLQTRTPTIDAETKNNLCFQAADMALTLEQAFMCSELLPKVHATLQNYRDFHGLENL